MMNVSVIYLNLFGSCCSSHVFTERKTTLLTFISFIDFSGLEILLHCARSLKIIELITGNKQIVAKTVSIANSVHPNDKYILHTCKVTIKTESKEQFNK